MAKIEHDKWYLSVDCQNPQCRRGIAIGEPHDELPTEPQVLSDILHVVCSHCGLQQDRSADELRFVKSQYRQ
jgi:hypothetical protein